jgi:hypothetical protein
VHPAKVQHGAKANSLNQHSALVAQYTAQSYLTQIAKRIDDLAYENYNIPSLRYQHRILTDVARTNGSGGVGDAVYVYTEQDYVDARETYSYDASAFVFKTITDAEQVKLLEQINKLLDTILNKNSVRVQLFRSIVGHARYQDFEHYLRTDLHESEIKYGDGMPSQLKSYIKLVSEADFLNSRYEKIQGSTIYGTVKYTNATIMKAGSKAESAYEDALERLDEIFSLSHGLERYELDLWMDRAIDFEKGIDRTIDVQPETIPRVRGSKSVNALDSGLPKLSVRLKREMCVLYVLLETVCDIAFVVPEAPDQNINAVSSAAEKLKLQQLLRIINPEKD